MEERAARRKEVEEEDEERQETTQEIGDERPRGNCLLSNLTTQNPEWNENPDYNANGLLFELRILRHSGKMLSNATPMLQRDGDLAMRL